MDIDLLKAGTTIIELGLAQSGACLAVFHLDELKYRSDLVKSRKMQWMTLTFGLVGATSFAEFIVYPLIKNLYSEYFRADFLPLLSFFFTLALIVIVLGIASLINKNK